MVTVHYSNLRENLKGYMDRVCDDYEPVTVARKGDDRNVVMLSEESYNNLIENLYLMGDRDYYDSLLRAKEQIERGLGQAHPLAEVDSE